MRPVYVMNYIEFMTRHRMVPGFQSYLECQGADCIAVCDADPSNPDYISGEVGSNPPSPKVFDPEAQTRRASEGFSPICKFQMY